jgi:acetylornithine/succinyldiaminopimelate/putrescine aminotransferase
VCDIVTGDGFLERVRELGARFEAAFAPLPFDLRRRGMLMAFVFDEPHGGMTAMKALFDAGVYAFFSRYEPAVLQFKPVHTNTDDESDEIIAIESRTFGA